jgi:hypothetical protein
VTYADIVFHETVPEIVPGSHRTCPRKYHQFRLIPARPDISGCSNR